MSSLKDSPAPRGWPLITFPSVVQSIKVTSSRIDQPARRLDSSVDLIKTVPISERRGSGRRRRGVVHQSGKLQLKKAVYEIKRLESRDEALLFLIGKRFCLLKKETLGKGVAAGQKGRRNEDLECFTRRANFLRGPFTLIEISGPTFETTFSVFLWWLDKG